MAEPSPHYEVCGRKGDTGQWDEQPPRWTLIPPVDEIMPGDEAVEIFDLVVEAFS
jgi:hypothetical protein